uniref:Lysozyme n=1 Tax=Panagrolaimus sp. JU765 TaxID=591449 RepID=A0AC34QA27_9BILA
MVKIVAAFTILFLALKTSEAALGFDAINTISSATFTCLKNAGHSFFVGRVSRSNGKVDTQGIQNIITARKAGFSDVDGYIFPCLSSSCPSAASQVTSAINALKNAGATIGKLWLDVEILSWPSSHTSNRAFIESMANTAVGLGYSVGIYSNYNNWQSIVGADYTGVSKYPLWWARYNGVADLSTGWSAFGGWSKPTIHQYAGDTTQCSLGLDKNFK